MKILFVASRFPYPAIQGDRVRAYHFLRLLNQTYNVTLVTPVSGHVNAQAQQVVANLCECWVPVYISQWQAITHLSRFPFSVLPLQTLYFCPPAIQKRVQGLLQAEAFDLVHVQLARMAPVVSGLGDVPKVLDFIDALSLNMHRRATQERGLVKWLFHLEARRMSHYEKQLALSFDRQTVSSRLDKEAIGAYENLHVIPNGVNIKEFPYKENEREDKLIVFTGRIGYFPNADAAAYFVTHVFPLIRQRVPDARFFIVGADPPGRVRGLARISGVEVTRHVPRIQDYLARAAVAVAPMKAGSGMQFKVLEAMASGTPVVATPYALGGMEVQNGEHLLVAADAQPFAEHVVRLLKDAALGRQLAREARRLVETRYTWDRSVRALEEVYRLAMSDFRRVDAPRYRRGNHVSDSTNTKHTSATSPAREGG